MATSADVLLGLPISPGFGPRCAASTAFVVSQSGCARCSPLPPCFPAPRPRGPCGGRSRSRVQRLLCLCQARRVGQDGRGIPVRAREVRCRPSAGRPKGGRPPELPGRFVGIRHLRQCLAAREENPKLSLKKIAAVIDINHMVVKRAFEYARLMEAPGTSELYLELHARPEHASRWRTRRQ